MEIINLSLSFKMLLTSRMPVQLQSAPISPPIPLLLNLPPEIRLMIFRYACMGDKITLSTSTRRKIVLRRGDPWISACRLILKEAKYISLGRSIIIFKNTCTAFPPLHEMVPGAYLEAVKHLVLRREVEEKSSAFPYGLLTMQTLEIFDSFPWSLQLPPGSWGMLNQSTAPPDPSDCTILKRFTPKIESERPLSSRIILHVMLELRNGRDSCGLMVSGFWKHFDIKLIKCRRRSLSS